jgi:mannan endo-1,4-beta-mannosidase
VTGHRRLVSCITAAAATTAAAALAVAGAASERTGQAGRVLWGAYMDGSDTYAGVGNRRWGDAPWDTRTWDRFERHAGKRVSIVHFGQPPPWVQPFEPRPADLVRRRGALPLIDLTSGKARLSDIAAGDDDAALYRWARGARAWGSPFFLRWDWEMNGDWFSWGAQAKRAPSAYVAAWRHFHDIVAAAGATNVTWVWCPNVEWRGSTPYEQLYPGDAYVDWTCLDGYNKASRSRAFVQLFRPSYARLLALAPAKPVMVAETSSLEYGGLKARWISDALGSLPSAFPQIKAFVWFNWRTDEDGRREDWPIESSAGAEHAFRSAIASPYFRAGKLPPLSPLTKIRPLGP